MTGTLTAGASSALDLHEGLSERDATEGRPAARSCDRWPASMRLHGSGGALVKGRCRATNLCDYCARLSAVEWSEMLALDALDGEAPQVWAVLTTRSTSVEPADFYDARRAVMDALRERFPRVRYCAVVEFTTGYGPRSGGARRPHWNLLLKGVPAARVTEAEAIITAAWCSAVDAEPAGQYVDTVNDRGGLMRYLSLHFLKESQRPPAGWSGQRVTFSTSRNRAGGYFTRPVWKLRQDAQRALRVKRELWKLDREGLTGAEALTLAEARVFAAEQRRWELVHVDVDADTGELRRVTPAFSRRYPFGSRLTGRDVAGDAARGALVVLALDALNEFAPPRWTHDGATQLVMTATELRRRGPPT